MKEILEILKRKGRRFVLAYLVCSGVFFLFEWIYMPWLTVKFGYWMFVPLFPSIVVANFLGVYLYDFLGEDILFMEFGSSWINEVGGKMEPLKKRIRNSKKLIFIGLSIWPSPIAGYLFFRDEIGRSKPATFKAIVAGSIPCTIVWGGLLALAWLVIVQTIQLLK